MAFVDISYSKDGGNNWSDWRKIDMGEAGDFAKRVQIRRLGRGRQFVFRARIVDPVRADILGASWMPEPCDD